MISKQKQRSRIIFEYRESREEKSFILTNPKGVYLPLKVHRPFRRKQKPMPST